MSQDSAAVHQAKLEQQKQSGEKVSVNSDETLTGHKDAFDLEKTMRAMVQKKKSANIKDRELGVYFKDLTVTGLGASASYQPTLGSKLNPMNIVESIQAQRHPPIRTILTGFEGVVRPGEMLLVLGRPGSGCSTLLKTLANQRDEYHSVTGDVHYDSLSSAEIAKHYRGDVQYCPEDDVHFPTLSVGETLGFAAKSRAPAERVENSTRTEYVDLMVNSLATVFGLRHVKDTSVGDAAIRGVSGGEKKRVSICEALATRSCIGAWDNSTRGLNASTALEFAQALRIATDIANLSTIVSIYQAGESLYNVFDKTCVIYDGRMVYYGPANCARAYFMDMGYEPANRQTTADFLVAVTDPNGRNFRAGVDPATIPRSAIEFANYFACNVISDENREDMRTFKEEFVGKSDRASAFLESVHAERSKNAKVSSAYTISIPMQAKAVMVRRVQILKGNMGAQVITLGLFIVQGIIMGTVFFRSPQSTSAFFSRGGMRHSALLFTALSAMAEIPALFIQRPIVQRHKKAALYHPFIEAVALTLVDIPITLGTISIFSIILYFLVGLQRSAGQFFIFFLFLLTMSLIMKAWFRMLASLFSSPASAQSVAGVSLLAMVLYTGYTIPLISMIGITLPIRYGFEALIVNEFHTLKGTCAKLVPSGVGYESVSINNQVCSTVGSVAGQSTVNGNSFVELSFLFFYSHVWRNFGIVLAFGVAFFTGLLVCTEFNAGLANETAMTLFKHQIQDVNDDEGEEDDKEKNEPTSRFGEISNSAGPCALWRLHSTGTAGSTAMKDVFSWHHIEYNVPIHGGESRRLLDNVSGFVAPGKLTALMGESGAGKTTLLNVLAQRTTSGVVTGDRFVNGQGLPKDFQGQTGYCQQMDTHLPTATVREALLFSAKLRQPADIPVAEKEAYVETCLKMCGLEAYADASVGSLDIEYRKRTTIAVELAAKPKLLLFLDEPTSGLDSQSAWAIMSFLRNLADNGLSILCTYVFHAPCVLLSVFDRLLLLRKGGQTVYFGDLGENAETIIHYFEQNGSRKCKPDDNPAEFMLEVIGAGATATVDEDWHAIWENSNEYKIFHDEIDAIKTDGAKRPPVETRIKSEYATQWCYQVKQLIRRGNRDMWRNPDYLFAKLALNITGGLFIGFTFFKAKDTLQGTQNKLFAIFMSIILSAPLSNQLQVPFLETRDIYEIRERPSRIYSWTALVTSQILTELPWNILGTGIYFLCWFWTVGFPSQRGGFTYLLLGVLFPVYYTTLAQAVSAMAPNAQIAAIIFSFLFSFIVTFNGVIQPFRALGWWRWMYHLSPYRYLVGGLLGQALGKEEINCSNIELVTLDPPSGQTCIQYLQSYITTTGGYLVNGDATSACQYCSARTTDEFLGPSFNIRYSTHWRDLGIFCAFILFNLFSVYFFTWLCRIRTGSLIGSIQDRLAARKARKSTPS
ncbi:hypothetical protein PLICRDRAFT_136999 [Plicaturopsis crispa FD-325 SS-3]|nr:hypothetical protein PLICRDRAFT_136999 [Plicaturopsis crispa FD-325 SS-3]